MMAERKTPDEIVEAQKRRRTGHTTTAVFLSPLPAISSFWTYNQYTNNETKSSFVCQNCQHTLQEEHCIYCNQGQE